MTTPRTNPLITASPTIHDEPPAARSPIARLTPQQLGVIGSVILDLILAQIAIALGNVTVLGTRPFAFLSEWGRDLQEKANEAYTNVFIAQRTATNAQKQVTLLQADILASNVVGGVSLSDQFNGASANNLGAAWTRTSDGPGAGGFGPNGSGRAVWTKSGGLSREHRDRYNTPLNTDYQAVSVVISAPAEPATGSGASTILIARSNAAATTFVFALIGRTSVLVGKFVSGSSSVWVTQSVTVEAGDVFTFIVGTDADDRQVILKQNNVPRITHTDTTSSAFGSDYRYVGLSSIAVGTTTSQIAPAQLEVWSAADRLPATV